MSGVDPYNRRRKSRQLMSKLMRINVTHRSALPDELEASSSDMLCNSPKLSSILKKAGLHSFSI